MTADAHRPRRGAVVLLAAVLLAAVLLAALRAGQHGTGASARSTPSPAAGTVAQGSTTTSAPGLPLWPVIDDTGAEAWRTHPQGRPWGGDPAAVAQHFAADFLGLTGLAPGAPRASGGAAEVPLTVAGRPVARVHLVRVGGHADSPWAVTGATSERLVVLSPAAEQAVTGTVPVRGTVIGVDEAVRTSLVTAGGRVIASTVTQAGSALPWQTRLAWTDKAWEFAALVAVTRSARDGSPSALSVTAVSRLE